MSEEKAKTKVLVWIEGNGVAHAIRVDEKFNSLSEDEKHWAYKKGKYGERTYENVLKMLAETNNKCYKIVEI